MEIGLRHVVDALPGLVWTARLDGHIDFLNRRWCEYTGLGVEEPLGVDEACDRAWKTATHPEDLPGLLERWRSILASGQPDEMEVRLRRFDGEYRWFLFSASSLVDASGRIVKWCGMNADIDDRKRAEEALRAHERRFRSMVDGFPALVALRTPAGDLEYANRRYLEYFGATLEKLKRSSWCFDFHPDDRPEVLAAWEAASETGTPCDIECRARVDGDYRWIHMHGFPLRDTAGRIVLWYLLHTDIDDRKRAETLLAGEKRLLEMVTTGHSMSGILEALCRLVESAASGCYCSVLLLDAGGRHLEHGAAPSLPASFINSINGRPVNIEAGPCGMAAYLNQQVIAADLTSETRWAAWRPTAFAHGLQACWSTPILSSAGKVLGVFAIYYDISSSSSLTLRASPWNVHRTTPR
jgi:PAS domain S-box-containing protein